MSLLCHGWYRISSTSTSCGAGAHVASQRFHFWHLGCSEEAAADRGIWDWLKEIELFREKPWGQKSSVCLGACDACDFLMDSSQRKYQGTGFLHILPETESGNFMALPGKKCVPRISELWVELKHANVGCDNPRNMVKHC